MDACINCDCRKQLLIISPSTSLVKGRTFTFIVKLSLDRILSCCKRPFVSLGKLQAERGHTIYEFVANDGPSRHITCTLWFRRPGPLPSTECKVNGSKKDNDMQLSETSLRSSKKINKKKWPRTNPNKCCHVHGQWWCSIINQTTVWRFMYSENG